MKSGICVKCNSETVHQVDTSKYADDSIPVSSWYSAGLVHYVCVTCGFVESYIAGTEGMEKIAGKKPRVPPRR